MIDDRAIAQLEKDIESVWAGIDLVPEFVYVFTPFGLLRITRYGMKIVDENCAEIEDQSKAADAYAWFEKLRPEAYKLPDRP